MNPYDCYYFTVEKRDDGVYFGMEQFLEGHLVEEKVEDSVLDELSDIVFRHRLDRWNGFDKVDRRVLDGRSFRLYITLQNGKTITADGSNKFPDGYTEAKTELCDIFWKLAEQVSSQHEEG